MHIEELRDGTVINLTGKALYIFHYIVSVFLLYGYMTLLEIIFGGKKNRTMAVEYFWSYGIIGIIILGGVYGKKTYCFRF